MSISSLLMAARWQSIVAQTEESDPVLALMDEMTVEEKVGQVFLVTFIGQDIGPESDIANLITEYHIGGVVLLERNGNIVNEGETALETANLINGLQQWAWEASQTITETSSLTVSLRSSDSVHRLAAQSPSEPFVPLFVAIDHEGDGYPLTRLTNGFSPVPNNMVIGATWSETHAEAMGTIVGKNSLP